jgi:ribosomal protein L11 methyltransferase
MSPVWLAPRVLVHAPGAALPDRPDGTIVLPQRPSAAFGDGTHPTTRLCARAVDLFCRQRAPRAVLDVGTGTGVLARLARAHGAAFVVGTDIDPVALAAARENVTLDDSDVAVHVGDEPPDAWGARFDLVVANILEEPLRALAPQLKAALAPGGALLLSGFTAAQAPALRARYADLGLGCDTEAKLEGWVVLQLSAA